MHTKKEKTLGGRFSTTVSQPDPEGSSKLSENKIKKGIGNGVKNLINFLI